MPVEMEFQDLWDKEKGKNCGTVLNISLEADKSLPAEKYPDKREDTMISAIVHSLFKTKENKPNQSTCCTTLKQTTILVWTERIFLISICLAVAGGFIVPIIIYAVDTDRGGNSTLSIDLDIDNCPVSDTDIQVCLSENACN